MPTERTMKCVVFAYSEVGVVCLEALFDAGADVAMVFTHTDDPNENIWFRSVHDLAVRHGVPVRRIDRMGEDDIALVRGIGPDIIFSFYFRSLIPRVVLNCARVGAYNMHGALLPQYRGRACVNWAVINGETETGATLHVMTDRADRGDIIAQKAVPIGPDETAHDVFCKVVTAAAAIMREQWPHILAGTERRIPQDESRASVFGRRTPADGELHWARPARELHNLVRGVTHPFPGAFGPLGGRQCHVWRTVCHDDSPVTAPPGTLLSRAPFLVATGRGALEITSLQYEHEEERSAAMRVFITGVNGFIGSHLVRHCLEHTDWEIAGIDINSDNMTPFLDNPRFRFVRGDIFLDQAVLEELIAWADVVLPLAGVARPAYYIQHPLRTFRLDFEVNLAVIRRCGALGRRVVFPSTSEVYGICEADELLEDKTRLTVGPICETRWIYSVSKQLIDRVLFAMGQEEGLDFTIFRPFNWTGPRLDTFGDAARRQARAITQMIYDVLHRGAITLVGDGEQRRSFTWIDDGIEALVAILADGGARTRGEVYNIGAPQNNRTLRELAQMVLDVMSAVPAFAESARTCRIRLERPESYYGPAYVDTRNRVPGIAKLTETLGWMPRTGMHDIVERTVRYYADTLR